MIDLRDVLFDVALIVGGTVAMIGLLVTGLNL